MHALHNSCTRHGTYSQDHNKIHNIVNVIQGMVQSAEYIYNKIKSEDLLGLAYNSRPDLGTTKYPLVCTGHSLGAGTAALLAILLRDREYPDVTCYAFSPPGGLIRYIMSFSHRNSELSLRNGWC